MRCLSLGVYLWRVEDIPFLIAALHAEWRCHVTIQKTMTLAGLPSPSEFPGTQANAVGKHNPKLSVVTSVWMEDLLSEQM